MQPQEQHGSRLSKLLHLIDGKLYVQPQTGISDVEICGKFEALRFINQYLRLYGELDIYNITYQEMLRSMLRFDHKRMD